MMYSYVVAVNNSTTNASASTSTMATISSSSTIIDINHPYYLSSSDHPGLALVTEALTEQNFHHWGRYVRIALSAKLKQGFIDGTQLKPASTSNQMRSNDLVISWLLNFISTEIRKSVVYMHTAKQIWDDFSARSRTCLLYVDDEESSNRCKVDDEVHDGVVPAYLLDRENTTRAKLLCNTIKEKRKEKAGKWDVHLPKALGIKGKMFAKKCYAEKALMKKILAMHEEIFSRRKVDDEVHDCTVPAYLLDRENTTRAKTLGIKGKIFAKKRHAEQALMKKTLAMHEESSSRRKVDDEVHDGVVLAYLLDRENTTRAKILSNMIKQKRKEKVCKWDFHLPKALGIKWKVFAKKLYAEKALMKKM
ncbi:hypothetical protein AgCh_027345 [Apium graveolens]